MAIHLSSISATFFVNLLNRLGVKPPPPDGFDLINTVQPVSLVDADISIPVVSTSMLLDVPSTAGELNNPVAATVMADTGALAVGNYNVTVTVGVAQAAGAQCDFAVQRRNAANNGNIWEQEGTVGNSNSGIFTWTFQAKIAVSERIRVVTRNGGSGAATFVEANIWIVQTA